MSTHNTTNTTATGYKTSSPRTVIEEQPTTKGHIEKDHIVYDNKDKQPTELREPKPEKEYKLRDNDKDYEFKPRTETVKTKDHEFKAWEAVPSTTEHVRESPRKEHVKVHEGKDHKITDVHDGKEHVKVHDEKVSPRKEHGKVTDAKVHEGKESKKDKIKDKVKDVKDKVKDAKDRKDKEHKVKKEHKDKDRVIQKEFVVYDKDVLPTAVHKTEHVRVHDDRVHDRDVHHDRDLHVLPTEHVRVHDDRVHDRDVLPVLPTEHRKEHVRVHDDIYDKDVLPVLPTEHRHHDRVIEKETLIYDKDHVLPVLPTDHDHRTEHVKVHDKEYKKEHKHKDKDLQHKEKQRLEYIDDKVNYREGEKVHAEHVALHPRHEETKYTEGREVPYNVGKGPVISDLRELTGAPIRDKQPTEFVEPRAEKDYQLKDGPSHKEGYEFKPRDFKEPEKIKVKDSKWKAYEEVPIAGVVYDEKTHHKTKEGKIHTEKAAVHLPPEPHVTDKQVLPEHVEHGQTRVVPVHGIEVREASPKRNEAQEILYLLQALLIEGKDPGKDVISEALEKAERLTLEMSRQPHLDNPTRRILEDIGELLTSANQMGKNKGFAEKLQNIALASHRALEANLDQDLLDPNATEFANNWRPLFYLIMNSREFRDLINDSLRIIWRIAYLYEDIMDDESEAASPIEIETGKTEVRIKTAADQVARVVIRDIETQAPTEITEEEWDFLQNDIQKVLFLLAKEATYRQGFERIFLLLDLFSKSVSEANRPSDHIYEDDHGRIAVTETEALVASFSGTKTLREFQYHLRVLIAKIQRHEPFRVYLSEVKNYILKPKSEDVLESKEFKQHSKDLASRGRLLMKEFREDVNLKPFLRSATQMMENIKNDEFLQLLRHHAGVIKSDLSYIDNEGTVQVDTDLLSNLQTVLLPVLADTLKYIPIPRIQSSTKKSEYYIDNVILCTHDILPENIFFHLETNVSFHDINLQGTHSHLVIELDRLLTEFKDVEFYFKKKTFPEISDSGRVTFRVKGPGAKLVLTYKVVQSPEDNVTRIMEGYADFNINEMEIIFDKSTLKHDVLIPMLTKMFKKQIKSQIEKQVEVNLTGYMIKLGELITGSITRVNRPFLSGIDAARKAVKTSKVYEKKKEKLVE